MSCNARAHITGEEWGACVCSKISLLPHSLACGASNRCYPLCRCAGLGAESRARVDPLSRAGGRTFLTSALPHICTPLLTPSPPPHPSLLTHSRPLEQAPWAGGRSPLPSSSTGMLPSPHAQRRQCSLFPPRSLAASSTSSSGWRRPSQPRSGSPGVRPATSWPCACAPPSSLCPKQALG